MTDEIDLATAKRKGVLPKLRLKPTAKKKPKPDPWDSFISDVGALALHLKVDLPSRELRFHPVRKWRFDLAWINYRVAIEREGGTWASEKLGHTTGQGYANNCEKYNEAALHGWLVLRFTSDMIRNHRKSAYFGRAQALAQIERALAIRAGAR